MRLKAKFIFAALAASLNFAGPAHSQIALTFNAIGPYVNEQAGYVCEGERWALISADDDPSGHLLWQGENGESREFAYRWNGKVIQLTDIKTGQRVSFTMVHLKSGTWLVAGKRLQECAG